MKKVILSAFGTAQEKALVRFDEIRLSIAERNDVNSVQWSFSSGFIRKILREKGITIPTPVEAVAAAQEDGSDVILLPFQLVPGGEYDRIVREISERCDRSRVVIGRPVISEYTDIPKVISTLLSTYGTDSSKPFIIAGHGNGNHPSDELYLQIDKYLQSEYSYSRCSTLDCSPSFLDILTYYKDNKIDSVEIVPFLFSSGKHVVKDIAGDGEESWKSQLEAAEISTKVHYRGMSEFDSLVDLWLEQLPGLIQQ